MSANDMSGPDGRNVVPRQVPPPVPTGQQPFTQQPFGQQPFPGQQPFGQPQFGQPQFAQQPFPGQPQFGVAPMPRGVVAAKTPGIAVLLSFLWLGAGHLYAGRTGVGVTLVVVDFFLVMFFLLVPIIGWILGFLVWVPLFVYAAVSSSSAVKAHNARWGIPSY